MWRCSSRRARQLLSARRSARPSGDTMLLSRKRWWPSSRAASSQPLKPNRSPRCATAAAARRISVRCATMPRQLLSPRRIARPFGERLLSTPVILRARARRSRAISRHALVAARSPRWRSDAPARRISARSSASARQLFRPRRIARPLGEAMPNRRPRRYAKSAAASTHAVRPERSPRWASAAAARFISAIASRRSPAASTQALSAIRCPRCESAAAARTIKSSAVRRSDAKLAPRVERNEDLAVAERRRRVQQVPAVLEAGAPAVERTAHRARLRHKTAEQPAAPRQLGGRLHPAVEREPLTALCHCGRRLQGEVRGQIGGCVERAVGRARELLLLALW